MHRIKPHLSKMTREQLLPPLKGAPSFDVSPPRLSKGHSPEPGVLCGLEAAQVRFQWARKPGWKRKANTQRAKVVPKAGGSVRVSQLRAT